MGVLILRQGVRHPYRSRHWLDGWLDKGGSNRIGSVLIAMSIAAPGCRPGAAMIAPIDASSTALGNERQAFYKEGMPIPLICRDARPSRGGLYGDRVSLVDEPDQPARSWGDVLSADGRASSCAGWPGCGTPARCRGQAARVSRSFRTMRSAADGVLQVSAGTQGMVRVNFR